MTEAVIGLLLVTGLLVALSQSVRVARGLTYANAQHVAAFGMCKAKMEEVRGFEFDEVVSSNFVAEANLQFAHLGGKDRMPITCKREVAITSYTNPVRKDVEVTVDWMYRGRNLQEFIAMSMYPK